MEVVLVVEKYNSLAVHEKVKHFLVLFLDLFETVINLVENLKSVRVEFKSLKSTVLVDDMRQNRANHF